MQYRLNIKRAILASLNDLPTNYAQTDDALNSQVCLAVKPRPTLLDIETALTDLESMAYIVGTRNELTGNRKWMLTDAGRCALSQF